MEFFLEYLGAIAKIESNFAWEVKEKGNSQTIDEGEDKKNNITRPI